jgi:hypothetical protein
MLQCNEKVGNTFMDTITDIIFQFNNNNNKAIKTSNTNISVNGYLKKQLCTLSEAQSSI